MEKAAEGKSKRKFVLGELSTASVQFKTRRIAVTTRHGSSSPASLQNSTCQSVSSGCASASCCSSRGLSETVKESTKFADLEQGNELTVEFFATTAGNSVDFSDRRENSPSSEFQAESAPASTARLAESNCRRCSTADKMPSHAEIEDFFAAAEKNLQKQFIDKYNYDIVKDEPTEGRYEWIHPNSTKSTMKKIKSDRH